MNDSEAGTAGPADGRQPTEEELRAAMEEQMRRVRVQDVILQTVATLLNLSGRRLGLSPESGDDRDLEQARLGIEATRALMPLLGGEESRAVKEALSQLQVAYAREAGAAPTPKRPGDDPERPNEGAPGSLSGEEGRPPAPEGEQPGRSSREEAEREQTRSRIWTPPGS